MKREICVPDVPASQMVLTIITDEQLKAFADAIITKYQQNITRRKAAEPSPGEWSRPSMMKVLVSSRRTLGRVAQEFSRQPSCSSLVTSMPPPPSHKTAEAADPPQTRTGAATRTRMTSLVPRAGALTFRCKYLMIK